MGTVKILVAEDDDNIRMGLEDTLESEGYQVISVSDGAQALETLSKTRFDLLLLDVMMPEKSGYDVCKEVRKTDETIPVIMLTAKGEEIDKVVGLQLGADDYITKPFGVHELLARIAAVLRRSGLSGNPSDAPPAAFSLGPVTVHPLKLTLEKEETTQPISKRERDMLKLFSDHPDEVLSRDRLLNEIWGIDYYGTTRTLDQHIAMLRKKIETNPAKPEIIVTVHGAGYKYVAS